MNNKEKNSQRAALIALRSLTILLLSLFLLNYLRVSVQRIPYPFELEWNEGDIAIAALRFAEGKPLYPAPEQGYVPYFYPPLYQMLCGLLFKFLPPNLGIGRAVSFLSSLGLALVLALIVWRWTKDYFAAAVAGLFYISSFRVSGFWTDLMRIDSFAWFVSFACVALLFNKNKPSTLRLCAGAILAVSAIFAKQNALLPIVPAALFLLIYHFRRAGIFYVITIVLIVNFFWLYINYDSPWFLKYYYQIPSRHHVFWENLKERLPQQFVSYLRLPMIFIASWLFFNFAFSLLPPTFKLSFPYLLSPITTLWFLLLLLSSIVAGFSGYLKIGGYVNNFIPILAVLSLLMGMAFHFFWSLFPPTTNPLSPIPYLLKIIVHFSLLIILMFSLKPMVYKENEVLPHPGSIDRGKELIEQIRSLTGRVYFPHHNYYAYLAGKDVFYSVDAVRDLNWAGLRTPQALRDALAQARFDWLILDLDLNYEWIPQELKPLIQQNYLSRGMVVNYRHFLELAPITGATQMKPRFLWQSRRKIN